MAVVPGKPGQQTWGETVVYSVVESHIVELEHVSPQVECNQVGAAAAAVVVAHYSCQAVVVAVVELVAVLVAAVWQLAVDKLK